MTRIFNAIQHKNFRLQPINGNLNKLLVQMNNCLSSKRKSLENELFIGVPKKEFQEEFGIDHKLSFGNKYGSLEDIRLWEEWHKIKISESHRNKIYRVIYADKKTPMKTLQPLMDYFKSQGDSSIFIALRQEKYEDELKLCLMEIDLKEPNLSILEDINLTEWLRSKKR